MRVLIVDDSSAARAQARAAVGAAADGIGVEELSITEANSGVAALRELATSTFELLVVDLHMPDVHGLDVLHFWQRSPSATGKAVMVSTAVASGDAERVARGGAAFLEKPLTMEGILPFLRSQP
jgi:two-component system, chemotaxis family, chemotaxis protein CheY